MRPVLRHGVIALTLIGCVAAAQADRRTRTLVAGGQGDLMDETTGSLGPFDGAALALSDEQKSAIYESVMRIPDVPTVRLPAPDLAQALAEEVPLQDLPAAVTRAIPPVKGHKFAKFDDRIVVVEPASRLVVAMIPRYRLLP